MAKEQINPCALVLIGALLLVPGAAAAETRGYFRDWLAICAAPDAAHCSASAFVLERLAPDGVAAQLRVSRAHGGTAFEIAFRPTVARPAPGAFLEIRVDGDPWLVLEPQSDFRTAARDGVHVLEPRLTAALLTKMRAGSNLAVRYVDADGVKRRYRFSLRGLSAALAFVHEEQGAAPPAGAAATHSPAAPHSSAAGEAPAKAVPSAVPPSRLAVPSLPLSYQCRGNEPFWELIIDENVARFARLGDAGEQRNLVGSYQLLNYLPKRQFVWRGAEPDTGDTVALVTEKRCLDTMSDREGQTVYPYDVRLSLPDGTALVGCCSAGPAGDSAIDTDQLPTANMQSKPPQDWSRLVPLLWAAVDACLRRGAGTQPAVTKVWPTDGDRVGVRLRSADGGASDCIALSDGSTVERLVPLAELTATPLAEVQILFTPAVRPPPAGACYAHERVVDEAGETLGWVSYNEC